MLGDCRPDWVVLGTRWGDGVAIVASTELDHAELSMETDFPDIYSDPLDLRIPRRRTELTVGMRTWTLVTAADYATAWANLLRSWSPVRRTEIAARNEIQG